MRGLYGAYGRTLTRTAGRNPRHVFEVNITKNQEGEYRALSVPKQPYQYAVSKVLGKLLKIQFADSTKRTEGKFYDKGD